MHDPTRLRGRTIKARKAYRRQCRFPQAAIATSLTVLAVGAVLAALSAFGCVSVWDRIDGVPVCTGGACVGGR